uniref:Uncharacterized protein n=1 Tax=Arundo donax TaxID=35708 RepID=A0A0A9BYX4_ARUDO
MLFSSVKHYFMYVSIFYGVFSFL